MEWQSPLPRYTYRECMERFGSDKPEMRYGMEIIDVSETVAGCGFAPFESALDAGGSVRGMCFFNCNRSETLRTAGAYAEGVLRASRSA